MISDVFKRNILVGLSAILFLFVIAILYLALTQGTEIVKISKEKFFTEIIPKSKKITIKNDSLNYQINPEISDFAKNMTNEINLFQGNVYVHHKTNLEKVEIRELDIIFTDKEQFWPGVSTKKGNLSAFDFSVDSTKKGHLYIWINPNQLGDKNKLSTTVNRTYFLALYVIKNWETYKGDANFDSYLGRVQREIEDTSLENRPIKITD